WRGIGIRIEDDVVVTRDGHDVLTGKVPREAHEIEALMARARAAMDLPACAPACTSSAAAWSVPVWRWGCRIAPARPAGRFACSTPSRRTRAAGSRVTPTAPRRG